MQKPYCLAMVLCDHVHQDANTGKFTILGTFSTFAAGEFPAIVNFAVYFAVTDGLGPTKLRLRLVDARCGIASEVGNEEGLVFEASNDLNFESPLVVVEGHIRVAVEIPAAGLYHCELWAGEEFLMSRRLLVAPMRDQHEEGIGGDDE